MIPQSIKHEQNITQRQISYKFGFIDYIIDDILSVLGRLVFQLI